MRLLWLVVGVGVGVLALRRVDLGPAAARCREFALDVRTAMAERELELHAERGGTDLVDVRA